MQKESDEHRCKLEAKEKELAAAREAGGENVEQLQ
jgi:hypothetical protein